MLTAGAALDPNEGEVRLDGAAREAMPAPAWRRRVTYLAAEPGWWGERACDHFLDAAAAKPLLPELGLKEAMIDRPIAELSTGERHRLALARVLVQSPEVMLPDEPTSGLDQGSTKTVEALLRKRLGQGVAILFSTHDEVLAERLGDRCLRMRDGRVTGDGA